MRAWNSVGPWLFSAPYSIGVETHGSERSFILYRGGKRLGPHASAHDAKDEVDRLETPSRATMIGHRQRYGIVDPHQLRQAMPNTRNKRRSRPNPEILERCVKSVTEKTGDKSRAYAICTASLQRSGAIKRGTQKLTAKGRERQSLTPTQRRTLAKIVRAGSAGLGNEGHFAIATARVLHRHGLIACTIEEKRGGKPMKVTCRPTAKGRRAA